LPKKQKHNIAPSSGKVLRKSSFVNISTKKPSNGVCTMKNPTHNDDDDDDHARTHYGRRSGWCCKF
jgi:hypothetical protein